MPPVSPLLLSSSKVDFFHRCLDLTCLETESESKRVKMKVAVDRIHAAAHPGMAHSVFAQLFTALGSADVTCFLQARPVGNPHCAFDVSFRGEHAVGESGPYREVFNDIVTELHSAAEVNKSAAAAGSTSTALLIPSINARVQLGQGRDHFVFNPACTSDACKQHLTFLGVLLGMAIRTNIVLPLSLPSLVWKTLLDIQPTRADLEGVDAAFVTGVLLPLESDDDDDAEAHFAALELTWSTTLSDGSTVELRTNGASVPVLFHERKEYARLAEFARLNESRDQIRCVQKGLASMIPAALLSLFTTHEFERVVCGVPFIDVGLLRRHAEYSGLKESDPLVQWFWRVLEDMTQDERRAFLVFSWAQQRMPASDADFTTRAGQKIRMLIKAQVNKKGNSNNSADSADKRFLTADTCFWNISLPAYSSLEVMRRMVLLTLSSSSGMDGDELVGREEQSDFVALQRQRQQEEEEAGFHAAEPDAEEEDDDASAHDDDDGDASDYDDGADGLSDEDDEHDEDGADDDDASAMDAEAEADEPPPAQEFASNIEDSADEQAEQSDGGVHW